VIYIRNAHRLSTGISVCENLHFPNGNPLDAGLGGYFFTFIAGRGHLGFAFGK
jgi:hypothetical protein